MADLQPQQLVTTVAPTKRFVNPRQNEAITSMTTGNTYTIGPKIGEGNFGIVYSCQDVWNNDLAAKVLKPLGRTYDTVKVSAEAEIAKLVQLRNPFITYVYDAFEFRDTFYIITERCYCPVTDLFKLDNFNGMVWLMPIARCLLQAIHYIHISNYAHQDIHSGNVFASFVKDEMMPEVNNAIQFKLGDLGVAKLVTQIAAQNTRLQWMLPPEVLNPEEYGQVDYRIDIYHAGLLLLQLANNREIRYSQEEILAGRPREMALALPSPYNVALEKALRRHVDFRTRTAMELWRDLNTPSMTETPSAGDQKGTA